MNHAELVEEVRKQVESLGEKDCSRAKADRFLAAMCKAIFDGLKNDGLVSLSTIAAFSWKPVPRERARIPERASLSPYRPARSCACVWRGR